MILLPLASAPTPRRWRCPSRSSHGSAPVWLFGVVHGHLGAVRTPLAEPAAMVGHARLLLTNALPLLVGWPPLALAEPGGPVARGLEA